MLRTGSVLVTGANRGIGLGFIRQLVNLDPKTKNIIAVCRSPDKAEELNNLASSADNVHVVQLDVRDFASYDRVYSEVEKIVGKSGLDLLINNAGLAIRSSLTKVTPQDMLDNYEVNTVAPLILSKRLLPLIKVNDGSSHKKIIVNISARMACFSDNTVPGGYYPYRASKTALNMITKSMAIDLSQDGIFCIALHPGWVATDLGGKTAPMKVDRSVSSMLKTIGSLDPKVNGRVLNYDGKVIDW